MLALSVLIDLVIFIRNLYTEPRVDKINTGRVQAISKEDFETLKKLIEDVEKEQKQKATHCRLHDQDVSEFVNSSGSYHIGLVKLNTRL